MIKDFFTYNFLRYALIAGILCSIVSGIIGVIITEKKMLLMSGGIAHTTYGGVGLGYLLGFEPIIGAFIFAVSSSILAGSIKRKNQAYNDLIIGLLWPLGMALGVIFVSFMPSYPPDLNAYLFGDILSISKIDLIMISVLSFIIVLTVIMLFENIKIFLFDKEFTRVNKCNTKFLEYLLLVLIAMSVVVLIKTTGIVLSIALLTAPAATSSNITHSFKKRMIYSILFGILYTFIGLIASYLFDVPTGAIIVVFAVFGYFLSLLIKKIVLSIKLKKEARHE